MPAEVNSLGLPRNITRWPVFLDGWSNPAPPPSHPSLPDGSFRGDQRLRTAPFFTAWFQALLTSLSGYFSSFLHSTRYAIGLTEYLGLPVGGRQFKRPNQVALLRRVLKSCSFSVTRLSRCIASLSRRASPNERGIRRELPLHYISQPLPAGFSLT